MDDLQKKYNALIKSSNNNMSVSGDSSLLSVNSSMTNGGNKTM